MLPMDKPGRSSAPMNWPTAASLFVARCTGQAGRNSRGWTSRPWSGYELVHTRPHMPAKVLAKHQALLGSIPLFAGLSSEQLAKVEGLAEVRQYAGRAVVVNQGEPARALFAIVRG